MRSQHPIHLHAHRALLSVACSVALLALAADGRAQTPPPEDDYFGPIGPPARTAPPPTASGPAPPSDAPVVPPPPAAPAPPGAPGYSPPPSAPYAAPVQPAPAAPQVEAGPGSFGATMPLADAEARRAVWKERGGVLLSYEGRVQGALAISDRTTAYGFGLGARLGLVGFGAPNPAIDKTTWYGFRAGLGYNWSYLSANKESVQIAQLPFALGFMIGMGSFASDDKWKGLVLGLAWAPAFSSTKAGDAQAYGAFNYVGFDLTFDFTSLEAALDKIAKESHVRISFFGLPPLSKNGAWVAQAGVGLVWY